MTESVGVENGNSKTQVPPSKAAPYSLYVAIIALIVVGNFVRVVTQDMSWTFGIYGSNACWFFLALAAGLIGFFLARRLKVSVPPLMAVLVCGVVGGVLTILTNPSTGVVAGLIGGSLSVSDSVCRRFVAFFFRWLLPTVTVAAVAGAVAALLYVNLRCRTVPGELMTTLPCLAIGLFALQRILRATLSRWQLSSWFAAVPFFLILTVVSFFLTMTGELFRRDQAMENVRTRAGYVALLGRLGTTSFQREIASAVESFVRPFGFRELILQPGSDSRDARIASAFPRLTGLHVEDGSQITDEDLARLDTRFLQSIDVGLATNLTSASIRTLDASSLGSVSIRGAQFDADTLAGFGSMPKLWILNLPGTRVTTDSFRSFDPVAPVWNIDLSYTLVDDGVLQHFATLPNLCDLNLRGTKIVGDGLGVLCGRNVRALDLSETAVDETQLQQMRPSGQSTQFPAIITGLSLANVPLSENGFSILTQFAELQWLDVSGSKITSQAWKSLAILTGLKKLVVDAREFDPKVLENFDLEAITLVVDGRQEFSKVREQVVALSHRFSRANRDDAPAMSTSIGIRIDNLSLDGATVEKLEALYNETRRDGPDLTLRNAELPNGARADISYQVTMIEFFKKPTKVPVY